MNKIEEIAAAIETGKAKIIADLVQSAIDAGEDPMEILNAGMVNAMSVIGERFSRGEAFVPEMLISARTMKKGVEVLKPHLAKDGTTLYEIVDGDWPMRLVVRNSGRPPDHRYKLRLNGRQLQQLLHESPSA